MSTQLNTGSAGIFGIGTSLNLLVNHLVSNSQGIAFRNKVTVVNEVPHDIQMIADKATLIPIIEELLTTVISNGRDSRIHISAERFGDVVVLNIQDRNSYNGYAMSFSVMSIEPQINEAGGSLKIDGKQSRVSSLQTTVCGSLITHHFLIIVETYAWQNVQMT